MNEDLREALGEAAEGVRNVDLYDRALARSGRLRRNRMVAATASALAVLGLAGAGLWNLPLGNRLAPPPSVASPTMVSPAPSFSSAPPSRATSTAPSVSTSARTATTPPAATTLAVPQSKSLADLPGRVFFRTAEDGKIVRLTADGTTTTVLSVANETAAVAPDGTRIAYLADGKVRLAGSTQPIFDGTVDTADQPLAWSPDGKTLLIDAPGAGVLTVASRSFAALPTGLHGQNFRWSGDGRTLIYGTADCRLMVAGAGASSGRTVPVLGDPRSSVNPEQTAGCIPMSSDPAGDRVALPLQSVGAPSGSDQADTLIDTATGTIQPVPVAGTVQALQFGPGGDLLVQSREGDRTVLSVFSPTGDLLVQARQPASITGDLLAYTD
jgi:TolB protein